MNIEFKTLFSAARMPTLATAHSAGFDLYASDACEIAPGATVMVHTGLALSIPVGFVGLVCPRSGLALKFGITVANAPGVIDSDYRGEVCVLLRNTSAVPFFVAVGDRIAQIVFTPVVTNVQLCHVVDLDETARGEGGFGSSGIGLSTQV